MNLKKETARTLLLLLLTLTAFQVHSQNIGKKKKGSGSSYSKILKTPYVYEFPTIPAATKEELPLSKPWIVYSDRNNNTTYTDTKLQSPLQKINFLDSFYVTSENKDLIEIIRCVPGLLSRNTINVEDPQKVEYVGWIEKSKVLLSQKSFLDLNNRRPLKAVTLLSGTGIFEKIKTFANGDKLKVFDSPEFQQTLPKTLLFEEIVYVYKRQKDKVLVGRKPTFNSKNASSVVVGWVQGDFAQSWGQRLCIDPFESDAVTKKPPLTFVNKEVALTPTVNFTSGYSLNEQGCGIPQNLKKRPPLLKTESFSKGKDQFKIVSTGAITSTFDKDRSYVYNVNGSKLNYSKLCDLVGDSKNVNIVIAINSGNDTKEYLNVLINAFQELAGFFISKRNDYSLKFGATDCSAYYSGNSSKIDLTEQYSEVLPALINMARGGVENKTGVAAVSGITYGLQNAVKLFKGHETESNIVIVISSQGDNTTLEVNTKQLKENLINDIAKTNTRLLMVQPYSGNSPSYANFIQQAKSIIKSSSEKMNVYKRDKMVGTNLDHNYQNNFRTITSGANNVYCLDYPENSNYQGFLMFPTIGNKIDDKNLSNSLDSLLHQIDQDNQTTIKSISEVFNSPSSFNNTINTTFQKFYSTQETLPTDISYYLKSIDYSYFINTLIAYPANGNAVRPFKQTLLLTSDEYDELFQTFKNLQFDLISPNYDVRSKTQTYNAATAILKRYSDERQTDISEFVTLGKFFSAIVGYSCDHKLLNRYKVSDLKASVNIKKEDFKAFVDHINNRLTNYYSLSGNSRYTFMSNGVRYYWVPEDYLP